jgi:hypothetical protein
MHFTAGEVEKQVGSSFIFQLFIPCGLSQKCKQIDQANENYPMQTICQDLNKVQLPNKNVMQFDWSIAP